MAWRQGLPFALAAAVQLACAASGWLGLTTRVDTEGLFSTTIKRATISAVAEGSPAQQAGLQAGDEIESVNDLAVPGTPAGKVKDVVEAVRPGDHVRLKVRRQDGEHAVDIVAGTRPAK